MTLKSRFTQPIFKLLIVLVLIASTGLSVASHYGISWDEKATLGVVDINYQLVTQRGDPNGIRQHHRQYYGTWFNVAAEAVFKGQQAISLAAADGEEGETVLLDQLRSKHVFTFLVSLITYVAVAGLVGTIAGWEFCWIGPLMLLLMPRFWGNSFFNPKDIPLAAMFTFGTWMGARLIQHFHQTRWTRLSSKEALPAIGTNKTTGYALLYGLLVGFVAGTRIDSSVLILYVIIVDVGLQTWQGRSLKARLKFSQFYALMLATAALAILTLYPGSWATPLSWYFAAFNFYYKEDWPHTVLFRGADIPADALPWDYLPTWIGITTPTVVLLLFAAGCLLIGMKYRQLSAGQKACVLLIGLQIFGLPLFAIIYQATLFDTLRQVLYVLPGIAAIASVAVIWLYQFFQEFFQPYLRPKVAGLALASGLVALALPIVLDMAALHPYEYVYFNRVFGGLPAAEGQFETDYWGVSMADSAKWIQAQESGVGMLVSSDPTVSAELFASDSKTVVAYDDFDDGEERTGSSFYYLSLPRWGFEQRLADCPVVYSTIRQQVPLARVKECS